MNILQKERDFSGLHDRQRMETIGLLAKDFNNAINIIAASIELVKNSLPSEDPKKNILKNAMDESYQAKKLVSDLVQRIRDLELTRK